MKPLTCEMCGSTNIIKEGDVFVCQSCGTKYSVEAAKKMMVEGTVDVKGTVKIDKTHEIDNLIHLAQSALEANNCPEALSYANRILEINSSLYRGWFLKMQATSGLANMYDLRCQEILSLGDKAISFSSNDEDKLEVYNCWLFCFNALMQFCINNLYDEARQQNCLDFYYSQKEAFGMEYAQSECFNNDEMLNLVCNQLGDLSTVGLSIPKEIIFGNENLTEGFKQASLEWGDLQDALIANFGNYELSMSPELSNFFQNVQDEILQRLPEKAKEELKKIEEEQNAQQQPEQAGNGGCYVATAVYGSYDCPEVWTLRRFRDYTLAETWYGRAFISTYYAISPTLVKWFGKTEWFKRMWQAPLDKLVAHLQSNGVKNTPYNDKY